MVSWICNYSHSILTISDTDTNVPLIVRGPGVPEDRKMDIVTSHTDLAPTFLSLAGATRRGLDGRPIPHKLEAAKADDKTEHAAIEYWGRVSTIRSTKTHI